MDIAKKIFNDQHNTSDLIDLFGKRYKIDGHDETFWWLCLNKINYYFVFFEVLWISKSLLRYKKWKRVWWKNRYR